MTRQFGAQATALHHLLRPLRDRRFRWYLAALVVASAAAAVAHNQIPPQGLTASYFVTPNWTGLPRTVLDPSVQDGRIRMRVRGFEDAFSVRWIGFLTVTQDDRYTFETISDDGSRVYIAEQLVVENGGPHGPRAADGEIRLQPGSHPVRVEFFQEGGESTLQLRWSRAGQGLRPIPADVFSPSPLSVAGYRLRRMLPATELVLLFLWFGTAAYLIGDYPRRQLLRYVGRLKQGGQWPAVLTGVLAGSFLINLFGVWWGLPGVITWAADELTPGAVLAGMQQLFAGGWYDKYPPLHFYVVAASYLPFVAAEQLHILDLWSVTGHTALLLAARLVSVVMATATVWVVYLCGISLFQTRHALYAAVITALTAPFVYYAKTANVEVPYLFWFALSLLFYSRLMKTQRVQDYLAFAVFAMLAICTKDQAYGFYALLTPVIAISRYVHVKNHHPDRAARVMLTDRALPGSALLALLVFAVCYNLPANTAGLVEHVRLITGDAPHGYRMIANTPAGHAELLLLTLAEVRFCLGWPMFIACTAGVIAVLRTRDGRHLWWLLVPAVSYYLFFISVILYNYDRFNLGTCFILALFAGKAIGDFMRPGSRMLPLRKLVVSLLFGYTLAYALSVNMLIAVDSRYYVERWMQDHVKADERVATVGFREYLPRLQGYTAYVLGPTLEDLAYDRPDYVLVNTPFSARFPPGTPQHKVLEALRSGEAGYRLALNYQGTTKWNLLAQSFRFGGFREEGLTNLDKINPRIEIFERSDRQ